jgi:HAD superfamily hydrolase (TIGR01509 family)
MRASTAVDWSAIDTVLLDMDGTLLDLRFDNWFWQEVIPSRYAAANNLGIDEAWAILQPKFRAKMGTIEWYCIDYWTRELGLDIVGIKRTVQTQVSFLPGAEAFLLKLKASGKRRVLITNAHPETLAIKDAHVALSRHFDASYSTHPFAAPKEDPAFWPRLQAREPFAAERTLFVDDSLAVLESARSFGIKWLRAVRCPDSGRPPRDTGDFAGVNRVADLI